ncbi:Uncharacterized conserved protein [Delftia tsuruhatensis]|uniref:DUF433 domain-containing protein n=1 Tax=Delftia tsuruhatensis TaxID=180282 RepID=UPI001E706F00|nr:DUF433 domain-containing protein [Delftia tsuruhatensis]CAB5710702.1 Uncharacterized conserved protein [Delftia tsuruhatensis]CAC9692236.1 Uncharacterized conserved protein [Delftia tsuruhatensis]
MYKGTGIYSVPEASRLIDVPTRDIHRWLFGYHYRKTPGEAQSRTYSQPLWTHELFNEDFDEKVIGFRDLLELRFIREFRRHGVPLSVIRRCLTTAGELYGVTHPMTIPRFRTDGRTIYAEALSEEAHENSLVDLKSRQSVFKDIIKPSLYEGIVYDASEKQASRWYPAGKKAPIVIDPGRQFGAPIIETTGTPTSILLASYLAEGGDAQAAAITARVYKVPPRAVEAAIRFELELKRSEH